jgi:hypothetical protein
MELEEIAVLNLDFVELSFPFGSNGAATCNEVFVKYAPSTGSE